MSNEHIVYLQDNNIDIGEIKYMKTIFSGYKKHFHNKLYLATIKSGSFSVEFNNIAYTIEANDVIVFSSYDVHKSINIDAKDYYMLSINEKFLNNKKCSALLKNDSLHNMIVDVFEQKCPVNKLISKVNSLEKESIESKNTLAYKTRDYIVNSIANDITVEKIANDLGYTTSHISREFKKAFGISPWQFAVILRTNIAKESLKGGNISHIAQDFGFFDQSHFNKNFKSIFATAPKVYKKS